MKTKDVSPEAALEMLEARRTYARDYQNTRRDAYRTLVKVRGFLQQEFLKNGSNPLVEQLLHLVNEGPEK